MSKDLFEIELDRIKEAYEETRDRVVAECHLRATWLSDREITSFLDEIDADLGERSFPID